MKSLKLLAVAALFGAFFSSCEADSITEDDQQLEIISSTGNQVDKPKGSGGDD